MSNDLSQHWPAAFKAHPIVTTNRIKRYQIVNQKCDLDTRLPRQLLPGTELKNETVRSVGWLTIEDDKIVAFYPLFHRHSRSYRFAELV
jgi:hypothetical protein